MPHPARPNTSPKPKMSSQAEKLHSKLDEIAERATQGTKAMSDMVQAANSKAKRIIERERVQLERAGRKMREASDRVIKDAE